MKAMKTFVTQHDINIITLIKSLMGGQGGSIPNYTCNLQYFLAELQEQVFLSTSVKAFRIEVLSLDCYKCRNFPGLGFWLMSPQMVQYLL